jgi:adenosylcobinamide-GDP ribazoletransferase
MSAVLAAFRRQGALLLVAIQFLTRVPVPAPAAADPSATVRAARFYPVVGQLVGAIVAAVWLVVGRFWSPPVAAAAALAAGALITGGFHEDGLADTADGLGGGSTPARRIEIMKDSRIGVFGVLALLAVLAVKGSALTSLSPVAGALALVAAHSAARAVAVLVMATTAYVGNADAAKGRDPDARVSAGEAACAAALGFVPLLILPVPKALIGAALAAGSALWLTRAAKRLIGGHTGDVLGAVEQFCEAAILASAALRF